MTAPFLLVLVVIYAIYAICYILCILLHFVHSAAFCVIWAPALSTDPGNVGAMRDRSYRDKSKHARVTLGSASASVRLAFVNRVCSLMSESRYAPNRTWQLAVKLSDQPELEESVFLELTDEGPLPSYPLASVVGCFTPIDIELGLSLASRWVIRDVSLASAGCDRHGRYIPGGPSP